jgi:hypothetical protein
MFDPYKYYIAVLASLAHCRMLVGVEVMGLVAWILHYREPCPKKSKLS